MFNFRLFCVAVKIYSIFLILSFSLSCNLLIAVTHYLIIVIPLDYLLLVSPSFAFRVSGLWIPYIYFFINLAKIISASSDLHLGLKQHPPTWNWVLGSIIVNFFVWKEEIRLLTSTWVLFSFFPKPRHSKPLLIMTVVQKWLHRSNASLCRIHCM